MGNTACCSDEKSTSPVETAIATSANESKPEPEKPTTETAGATGAVLALTFELPDKTTKEISFAETPLGIDFSKSLPLTVRRLKPGCCADRLGVEADWVVTLINGSAVNPTFDEALTVLKKAVVELKQMPSVPS